MSLRDTTLDGYSLQQFEIDHIEIALTELSVACQRYALIGFEVRAGEIIRHEGIRNVFTSLPNDRIEFLQALPRDSITTRLVERNGERTHHAAPGESDEHAIFERLHGTSIHLASTSIKVGASASSYFFIHALSTGRTLIELGGYPTSRPASVEV